MPIRRRFPATQRPRSATPEAHRRYTLAGRCAIAVPKTLSQKRESGLGLNQCPTGSPRGFSFRFRPDVRRGCKSSSSKRPHARGVVPYQFQSARLAVPVGQGMCPGRGRGWAGVGGVRAGGRPVGTAPGMKSGTTVHGGNVSRRPANTESAPSVREAHYFRYGHCPAPGSAHRN
jgi:hypothetical protein